MRVLGIEVAILDMPPKGGISGLLKFANCCCKRGLRFQNGRTLCRFGQPFIDGKSVTRVTLLVTITVLEPPATRFLPEAEEPAEAYR